MKSGKGDDGDDPQIYGAYHAYKPDLNARDWLKLMSCTTKEPSFTSFTNIRGCVDYIFYESDGIFEVVRTLDIPSYSRYLKGNI